jgi:hypothetical protein
MIMPGFFAKCHRTSDAFSCGGNCDGDFRVGLRLLNVKCWRNLAPVCTENLNPHVMVMKSAEDWVRFDISSR